MTKNKKNDDHNLADRIQSEAYLTFMVSCLVCERDLQASDLGIDEPFDPMERWAMKFSEAAKLAGWSTSKTDAILCPDCKDRAAV